MGITAVGSSVYLDETRLDRNSKGAVGCHQGSICFLSCCDVKENGVDVAVVSAGSSGNAAGDEGSGLREGKRVFVTDWGSQIAGEECSGDASGLPPLCVPHLKSCDTSSANALVALPRYLQWHGNNSHDNVSGSVSIANGTDTSLRIGDGICHMADGGEGVMSGPDGAQSTYEMKRHFSSCSGYSKTYDCDGNDGVTPDGDSTALPLCGKDEEEGEGDPAERSLKRSRQGDYLFSSGGV